MRPRRPERRLQEDRTSARAQFGRLYATSTLFAAPSFCVAAAEPYHRASAAEGTRAAAAAIRLQARAHSAAARGHRTDPETVSSLSGGAVDDEEARRPQADAGHPGTDDPAAGTEPGASSSCWTCRRSTTSPANAAHGRHLAVAHAVSAGTRCCSSRRAAGPLTIVSDDGTALTSKAIFQW